MGEQLAFLTPDGALDAAIAARDEGMQRAVDHADEDNPGWSDRALTFLHDYALLNPQFTGYMVVMASENDPVFPEPPTAKSWGAIFTKAVRLRWIANSGKTMPHPKRHACPAIIWGSLIYRSAA